MYCNSILYRKGPSTPLSVGHGLQNTVRVLRARYEYQVVSMYRQVHVYLYRYNVGTWYGTTGTRTRYEKLR